MTAIEGWFTTGEHPALVGSRCAACAATYFPPVTDCRDPACGGQQLAPVELSRRGRVWSYTDARYQPPPPYVAADPFVPFALAAVELPEGIVVLGQVATGFGVADLRVGAEVELVVEEQPPGEPIWKWKPVSA